MFNTFNELRPLKNIPFCKGLKVLGPGLFEKVYEVCFCHKLSKRGLKYKRQVGIKKWTDPFEPVLSAIF